MTPISESVADTMESAQATAPATANKRIHLRRRANWAELRIRIGESLPRAHVSGKALGWGVLALRGVLGGWLHPQTTPQRINHLRRQLIYRFGAHSHLSALSARATRHVNKGAPSILASDNVKLSF